MPMIEPMLAAAAEVDDALLEALRGLERLDEQQPVLDVLERRLCSLGATGNVLGEARPQPSAACRSSYS